MSFLSVLDATRLTVELDQPVDVITCSLVLHEGVVSVRRMYSPAEQELLARCAPGGEGYRATNFGPQYVTLTWTAPSSRSSSP